MFISGYIWILGHHITQWNRIIFRHSIEQWLYHENHIKMKFVLKLALYFSISRYLVWDRKFRMGLNLQTSLLHVQSSEIVWRQNSTSPIINPAHCFHVSKVWVKSQRSLGLEKTWAWLLLVLVLFRSAQYQLVSPDLNALTSRYTRGLIGVLEIEIVDL